MKIELVKFRTGKFGIRKSTGFFVKDYMFQSGKMSLNNWLHVIYPESQYEESEAKELFYLMTDIGEVVK